MMDESPNAPCDPSEDIPEFSPEGFSWTHEFDGSRAIEQSSDGEVVEFDGLQWSLFQRPKHLNYEFFAGVSSTASLPYLWKQTYCLFFQFLNMRGVKNISFDGHDTLLIYGGKNERQDMGRTNVTFADLEAEVQARKKDPTYKETHGEECTIKLMITVKKVFRTREIPLYWNSREKTGMLGLRNLGATCYLNALLQMLYHMNAFRTAVYRIPVEGEELESSITLALQDVFRNLQVAPALAIGNDTCVTTKHLTKAFGWTTSENFLQQDATELLKFLIDRLEQKMGPDAIKILFEGSTKNFIRCVNVQMESSHEEAFQDIQLDVEGCDNIYQSMKKFVEVERLDGENQYDAGEEHGKQDAEKGTAFTKFPHILTIHLKRFAFSAHTMNYSKIHTKFAFPEILDMEKFLTRSPESNPEPSIYRLHSILIHRGDVGSGHYYSYVKPSPVESTAVAGEPPTESDAQPPLPGTAPDSENFPRSGWYRFDDERVYDVEKAEAVDYNFGKGNLNQSAASAYMLMYIRESMMDTIMKGVSADDIPASLSEHLDSEHRRLQQAKHAAMRPKIVEQKYCLPEHLERFHNYGVAHDLYEMNGTDRLVSLCEESSRLAVLFQIAAATETPICDFVLLKMRRKNTTPGSFAPLRPWKWYVDSGDELPDSKLHATWDEKRDVLNLPLLLVHRNQTCIFVGGIELAEQDVRVEKCRAEWESLRKEEAIFLEELHALCKECVPGMASPDYDPKIGCNILNSSRFLELTLKYKHNLSHDSPLNVDRIAQSHDALKKKFCSHFLEYGNFMKHMTRKTGVGRRVLFAPLKVFDEHCLLPKLEALPPGINALMDRDGVKTEISTGEKKIFNFVKFIVVVVDENQYSMRTREFYDIIERVLKTRCPTYDPEGDLQVDASFSFSQTLIVSLKFPPENLQHQHEEKITDVIIREAKERNFFEDSDWKLNANRFTQFDFCTSVVLSVSLRALQSSNSYELWAGNLANTVYVTLLPTCKFDAEIALNLGRPDGEDGMDLESGSEYIRHLSLNAKDRLLDAARKIGMELCIPLERLVLVLGALQNRKKFGYAQQFWPYTKIEQPSIKQEYAPENITIGFLIESLSLYPSSNKLSVTIYYRVVPFPLCRIFQLAKQQEAGGSHHEQPLCVMNRVVADSGGGAFPVYSEVEDIREDNIYLEVNLVDATLRKLCRQEILNRERNGHDGHRQAHPKDNTSDAERDTGGAKRARLTHDEPRQNKDGIKAAFDQLVDKVYCAIDKNVSWATQLRDRLGIPRTFAMISPHGLEISGRDDAPDAMNHSDEDVALIFFRSTGGSADCIFDDSNASQPIWPERDDNWYTGYWDPPRNNMTARTRCVPPIIHCNWFIHPVDIDTFQLPGPPREPYHLCAQLVSARDLRYMRGEGIVEGDKEVRSTLVKVQFFTLQGPTAHCLHFDVETTEDEGALTDGTGRHNRPFFSFVREDDTYTTLHARLSLIVCGEEDADDIVMDNGEGTEGLAGTNGISTHGAASGAGGGGIGRLAVIDCDNRVHFLPEQKGSLVWDKLKVAYPQFCEHPLREALRLIKRNANYDKVDYLPTLGLQLSEGKLKDNFTRPPKSTSLLSKRKASDTNMSMKQ